MRHTIPTLAVLAAMAAVLAGCETKPAAGAIPRRTFVRANVDLRSVPDTATKGDSLRRAALRKHRVTEADLRAFLTVHGRDTEYLASVWREVADSVQRRWEASFPSMAERHGVTPDAPGTVPGADPAATASPPGAIPGLEADVPGAAATPGAPPRAIVRPPNERKPPPPPVNEPPPPDPARPRPMVRPPPGPPPDARGPTTVPVRRPVAVPPRDSR
jgi:hypothetical protein